MLVYASSSNCVQYFLRVIFHTIFFHFVTHCACVDGLAVHRFGRLCGTGASKRKYYLIECTVCCYKASVGHWNEEVTHWSMWNRHIYELCVNTSAGCAPNLLRLNFRRKTLFVFLLRRSICIPKILNLNISLELQHKWESNIYENWRCVCTVQAILYAIFRRTGRRRCKWSA